MPLSLRRGRAPGIRERHDALFRLEVDGVACVAYPLLTGPVELDDEVLVNVQARELELGSGGFDVLYANLTRGLELAPEEGAHVMVLPYTPLQHARLHVEEAGGPPGGLARLPGARRPRVGLGRAAGGLLLVAQPGRARLRRARRPADRLRPARRRRAAGLALGHGAGAARTRAGRRDRGSRTVLRRGRAVRLGGLGARVGST